jgi:hypothetical protein
MRENRKEPRVNMMQRIIVVWSDENGTEQTVDGKLEDLSNGGMSIQVNAIIPTDTRLMARTPLGHFSGTVVRSRRVGQGCVLGVKRDVG